MAYLQELRNILNNLKIDRITGAQIVIDSAHHEIHDGEMFYAQHLTTTATNTNEETAIAFKTPVTGTKKIHMLYKATASAAAHFHIREGIDVGSAGGTEYTPLNHCRGHANMSIMRSARQETVNRIATYSPADSTNLTGGTEIYLEQIGATGQGNVTVGGDVREFGELLLQADTNYSFVVQSIDTQDNIHQILLTWYEENE